MEKQLLGGLSVNEFVSLNFEGVMDLPNIDMMTCGLGRCWIATPRDGFDDVPNIGGVAGNDSRQGALLGVMISVGAPVKRKRTADYGGGPITEYVHLGEEEMLFDSLANMYPVGNLVAVRPKVYNADFSRNLLALGVISEEYADRYRICTAELFDIYASFSIGLKAPSHE